MRNFVEYDLMKSQGLSTATFTAAVTNICTSTAHGLENGDRVVLTTTTTLPAGLALATVYYVRDKATNTFKLALTAEGDVIDVTNTGTGTHTWTEHDIGRSVLCQDFAHAILSVEVGTDATMTLKIQGSLGDSVTNTDDAPDFSAAQSQSNAWDYVEVVDLEDGSSIDGDTGISLDGADVRQFEVNINALRWLNVIISAWTDGDVSVRCRLYND